jgi:hypothetical protein
MTKKRNVVRPFLLWPAVICAVTAQADLEFRRTTVTNILKDHNKFNGAKVELHGRITLTQEIGAFEDETKCGGLGLQVCALWTQFDRCSVVGQPIEQSCDVFLRRVISSSIVGEDRRTPAAEATRRTVVEDVTIRGVVSTIRKDLRFDKSVPESARWGMFGHLGAYPGQIDIQQIQLNAAQPGR